MSTRSRIGIQLSDDSILSVYHHWDGNPEWLGRILNTHYNSKNKVEELIDGGDMSTCWTNERWTGKQLAPYVKEIKEQEEYGPQYYSQRGEDCPPRLEMTCANIFSPIIVRSLHMSSVMISGCAMICTCLIRRNYQKLSPFLKVH